MALKIHANTQTHIRTSVSYILFVTHIEWKIRVISFFFERTSACMCVCQCKRVRVYEYAYNFFSCIFVVRSACLFVSFTRWYVRFACSPADSIAFGLQRTQKCYLNLSTESSHFIESRLLRVFRAWLFFRSYTHTNIFISFVFFVLNFRFVLLRTFVRFSKLFFWDFWYSAKKSQNNEQKRYFSAIR